MKRRKYNLIPPPLGPGEVGPVIECVSDRERSGEPLPPPIELIPWGSQSPPLEVTEKRVGEEHPLSPPA